MSEQQPYRHNLRFENHGTAYDPQHTPAAPRPGRVTTGETTVTCSCGLDTGALPSDDARLVYEVHRNVIRDETSAGIPRN
ncbi:hypothetical protein ACFWUZ_12715 [Streptomyces sp. NPDC058646]|uniref:hypothetical protein n=1 Tax=Streptomyces sp. NPDC058646 TaxID=3346574 RepID=UPI003656C689